MAGDRGEKGCIRIGAGLGNRALSTVGNLRDKVFPRFRFEGELCSGVCGRDVILLMDEKSESDDESLLDNCA